MRWRCRQGIMALMKKVVLTAIVLLLLIIATTGVVFYGKGVRLSFNNGKADLSSTGLLDATSSPDGAQVFINGHLTTATDSQVNLSPGTYEVKIFKQGYFPWEKKVNIDKGVVTKADALLFPKAPKLESITNLGVNNPVIDPTHTKIAYTVSTQDIKKNGIYILDSTNRPILTLQGSSSQIADNTTAFFSSAMLAWAPDGSELTASISAQGALSTYVLRPNTFNDDPSDVTATLQSIKSSWLKIKTDRDKSQMNNLPSKARGMVKANFKIIAFSPDETKVLYSASTSANLPVVITPPLIGTNSTPQERSIKKGSIYVYDVKEDRNYLIKEGFNETTQLLEWLPDSAHLIYVHDKNIDIMDFDGTNSIKVYAGPFLDRYVFPWTDTSRIVILTDLGNSDSPANLYTISLK